MKLVSLMLTTYNCKDNLIKTLESIDKQDYPLIEVCIADSCSNDGTLDVIKDYEKAQNEKKELGKQYKKVVWKSQKDSGIYEGLNNSYALTTGDYIQVMNDEFTCDDAVTKLVKAIEKSEEASVIGVHSDLVYAQDGVVKRNWHMGQGNIRSGWMPAHPTLMLKREIYEKYGTYDTSYVSAADYEYMVRFLKDSANELKYVPEILVSMYYGGTSTNGAYNYWRSITESLRALRENKVKFGLWITFLRTLKVAKQFR